jgi:hypothetical protein
MNEVKQFWLGIISIVAVLLIPVSYIEAADFNAVGDVGCRSPAISNLKNLAGKTISFFGLGDYSYKCSSSTIKPLWDQINSKKGVQGNHECERSDQDSLSAGTYFGNGGCSKGYFAYIRGGNTVVIGLNPYTSYKAGSPQYNFVVSKTNEYKNNPAIYWIVYILHPLFYPVGCSDNHCHGIDNPGFKSVYEPIIKSSGKGFIIQAHTHLTAFGTPKGIGSAICGGGGEDGSTLGSLNGYSWATSSLGYCKLHFELGKATAQLIGTSNNLIHTHTWNRN